MTNNQTPARRYTAYFSKKVGSSEFIRSRKSSSGQELDRLISSMISRGHALLVIYHGQDKISREQLH